MLSWTAVHAQSAGVVNQARQYITENADRYGVPDGAAQTARVSSSHTSNVSGLTYVYFQQTLDGIDVIDGDITVALRPNGTVFYTSGRFARAAEMARGASASLDAVAAAEEVARYLGYVPGEAFRVLEHARDAATPAILSTGGIAEEPVRARQIFEPVMNGREYRLAWEVLFYEPDTRNVWRIQLDANTGEVLSQYNMVLECHFGDGEDHDHADHSTHAHSLREASEVISLTVPVSMLEVANASRGAGGTYRVYADPVETPNHGERTLVTNPADPVASPHGWHTTSPGTSYTITRGNNTHTYADTNGTNQPSGANNTPDGGPGLVFDFPVNLTQAPSTYRLAAVTNLFYIVNRTHDILYHHGFDEAAGNFQEVNYTGAPGAGDYIRAEAQDGSGMNNAYFWYSAEGSPARIEMFLWNQTNPNRDGDFDNGIIGHEYGHGWSLRLTGGRLNNTCLGNQEQMGEGWSDFLGLIMTMRPGDTRDTRRGVGTYVLGQPTTGQGIRPAPYTTNMAENSYTYGNIGSLSRPHGVGFLWNTMLWELTWNLIDRYGFSTDLINGNGGNNIALTLVSEAMKLQPCSPGFVDGRNAILAADEAIFDGAHALEIWTAFAKRGLGYSASQGSANSSTDGSEAFDLPPDLVAFSVEPGSLEFNVPAGWTDSAELSINNEGLFQLNWDIVEGEIVTEQHEPSLDEVLNIPNFTVHPSSGATFNIPAGVTTSGNVTGFTFQGSVVMQGSSDWASDMRLIITSPGGASFNVGGFNNIVNTWDFQGNGSSSNGTYSSTHLNIFGPDGTSGEGEWTLAFTHGWTSGNNMNWSNVTVTLHKLLEIDCGAPWLTTTPESGSTDPDQTSPIDVDVNTAGLNLGEYLATLCLTTAAPLNVFVSIPVALTVEEGVVGHQHVIGSANDGPGWRMLSSPTGNATVLDLAEVGLIYGFDTEYPETEDVNPLIGYDGAGFVAPSALSNALVPGKGFIWWLWDREYPEDHVPYEDGGSSSNQWLPINLIFSGSPVEENYQVTFTEAERAGTDDGWFLIGNPYAGSYNLAGIISKGDEELSHWFWHWDPVTNYSELNAAENAVVDTGMGFFAEFVESPTFPVTFVFGPNGAERGVAKQLPVHFELTGELLYGNGEVQAVSDRHARVIFSDDATDGRDRLDANKLDPLLDYWATIALVNTQGDDPVRRAIESRPIPLGIVTIPLALSTGSKDGVDVAGTFTITLTEHAFGAGWQVSLHDLATGETVDLLAESYTFGIAAQPPIDAQDRFEISFSPPTVSGEGNGDSFVFGLEAVWPNPTVTTAQVDFTLEEAGEISLDVFDVLGRRVAQVASGEYAAGRHVLPLNTNDLASGVYVVRLTAGSQVAVQRVTVAR